MLQSNTKYEGYTMGHTKSTTARHAARTTQSDAAFLLPHIHPHHHILDVGCGPGTITAGFMELVPRGSVTGIDISNDVLQQARENTQALIARSPDVPRGKIAYQEENVVAGLSFQDDAFDVVFASQVLIHLLGQDMVVPALKEVRRVVKPGGFVATRDGAKMLFYPEYGLERLWEQNLLKGIGIDAMPGPKMRGYYRLAGFDVDGHRENGQEQVIVGVGSNVYAGTTDERKAYIRSFASRFNPGEPFRESWIKVGIPEEEINELIQAMEKWADTEDAWATTIQSEVLAWK